MRLAKALQALGLVDGVGCRLDVNPQWRRDSQRQRTGLDAEVGAGECLAEHGAKATEQDAEGRLGILGLIVTPQQVDELAAGNGIVQVHRQVDEQQRALAAGQLGFING